VFACPDFDDGLDFAASRDSLSVATLSPGSTSPVSSTSPQPSTLAIDLDLDGRPDFVGLLNFAGLLDFAGLLNFVDPLDFADDQTFVDGQTSVDDPTLVGGAEGCRRSGRLSAQRSFVRRGGRRRGGDLGRFGGVCRSRGRPSRWG
jgi:hypothetical protein